MHNAVANVCGNIAWHAGAMFDHEARVPALYRPASNQAGYEEAVLDLAVSWPGPVPSTWVDVNVHCPWSSSYTDSAAHVAGYVAELGDNSKFRRYGPTVAPLSMEVGGRLSTGGMKTLERIAGESAVWGKRRTGSLRAGCTVGKLRRRIEATLLRHTAACILLSIGAHVQVYGALDR